jgi:hypothetical protein
MALREIEFDPDGKPLSVEINFPTQQSVAYTLTLYEASSNSVALRETGNNENPEDDRYPLPTPPKANKNRILQFDATFVDPGDSHPDCRAEAVVKQGAKALGKLVVQGTITESSLSGTDFARLTT